MVGIIARRDAADPAMIHIEGGAEKSLMLENKKRPPDDVNRRWMLFFDKGRPGGNNDEGGVQPRGIFHSSSLTLKFPVQVVCPF